MIDRRKRKILKMENKDYISKEGINVITHSDNFELETFEMSFIKWIRGFKKNVLDVEFKGDKGETETEVSDNKISFRSTIKWGLDIERIDGHLYWFSVNWNFPCFELVLKDNPNRRRECVRTERVIRLKKK